MRKYKLFGTISIMLAAALALSVQACRPEQPQEPEQSVQLATPQPKLGEVSATGATLSWEPVEGALYYNVWYEGDENPDRCIEPTIALRRLEPETAYTVRVTAEPATQSAYTSSAKSNAISFTTEAKPRLKAPDGLVSNLTTVGFDLTWPADALAGSYAYTLGDEPQKFTADTLLTFSDLTPGTGYKIRLRAIPGDDSSDIWAESPWSEFTVTTPVPLVLPAPAITLERESSIHTVISWDAVQGADAYEYSLDGATPVRTQSLSATFDGLPKGSTHTFTARAVADDPQKAVTSPWAEAGFTAIYDFKSTLAISAASATDRSVTFEVSAQTGELNYRGVLPKASFLNGSQIDSAAVFAAGRTTALCNAGGTVTATDGICYGTTYLCYAFGVNEEGELLTDLKLTEVKTQDYTGEVPDGENWATGNFATIQAITTYGISSSAGAYGPESFAGFTITKADASITLSAIKYYIFTLSAFRSNFSDADALKTYFETKGSAMSDANLTKINSGTAYSSGYTGRTADTAYVLAMAATSSTGETMVAASTIRTAIKGHDWLHISVESPAKFTVTSDLPVSEGKASCAGLSASNNQPSLLAAYVSSKGTAISATRIEALCNGTGYTASYTLTGTSTYGYFLTMTNLAGDTITRCCPVKPN